MAEHQPRERDVLCQKCMNARTWNIDAICDSCKAKAVKPPHRDYTTLNGRPRPMDMNHHVPGDTPCKCGGIAHYHGVGAVACDDCNECEGFEAAS